MFYLYLLLCAALDYLYLKVPNYLTLGVLPLLLIYRFMTGSWAGLLDGLAAYLIVVVVLFIPFAARALGAGDLKFFANIAAFIGIQNMLPCFVLGALCSLPPVIYYAIKHKERLFYLLQSKKLLDGDSVKMPYTPPFAMGAFIFLQEPSKYNFLNWY